LLAVLALLAGCGGTARLSKTQYEQKVRSVYEDVRRAFRETKVGEARLPGRIEAAQQALRRAAGALDDTKPPEKVVEANHELAEAMRGYAEELDKLRRAAEAHDARAVAKFNARLPQDEAVERIAEAAEEIRQKGYDLGPIATD
jgi:hypothetical protein